MIRQSVTQKRDLRQATPYWQSTPHISVRSKKTTSSRDYDSIVVGTGISGALVAEALSRDKCKLAILDRRAPVLGSTMASTAMLQHEIDLPLFKMVQSLGKPQAEAIWLRSAEAVQSLQELVKRLGIDCQMHSKSALYLAGDQYGARALAMEAEARSAIHLDATLLDKNDLKQQFNIDRSTAIVSTASASANPAQLTAGLLRSVQKRGAEIVQNCEITDFISLNDRVILSTSTGKILTAKQVIFCTGYEFLYALANKNHKIISTWAIATRRGIKLPRWLPDFLVWEGSDPYLYFRTSPDGRIIAGGEDEDSADAYLDNKKLHQKTKTITTKISKLLGCELGEPEFFWAAAFGDTRFSIPMIGEVPGHKNVFAVMGYGGNGITFSKIAADIISAKLRGKSDPDEDLFKFR